MGHCISAIQGTELVLPLAGLAKLVARNGVGPFGSLLLLEIALPATARTLTTLGRHDAITWWLAGTSMVLLQCLLQWGLVFQTRVRCSETLVLATLMLLTR
jgi:hypothetical protein